MRVQPCDHHYSSAGICTRCGHRLGGTYPDPVVGMTTGHSGTDTSAALARDEAESGAASKRLREVYIWLVAKGRRGGTVGELRHESGLHHGQASSALTNLHRQNRIARLVEKRNRSHVYVTTEDVDGRDTEEMRSNIDRCPFPAAVCAEESIAQEKKIIELTAKLNAQNRRLAEIHSLLHQSRYNGQPGLRMAAIQQVVEPRE